MARCQAASLISPKARESVLRKRTRVGLRLQAMSRRHPTVKTSRITHTPRTLLLVLVSYSANTRTPMLSLTLERKSRQHDKGSIGTVPRRTAPQKTPVDHCLPRKGCQLTRCSEMELDKKHGCLTHALMLGIMTKLPTMSQAM